MGFRVQRKASPQISTQVFCKFPTHPLSPFPSIHNTFTFTKFLPPKLVYVFFQHRCLSFCDAFFFLKVNAAIWSYNSLHVWTKPLDRRDALRPLRCPKNVTNEGFLKGSPIKKFFKATKFRGLVSSLVIASSFGPPHPSTAQAYKTQRV